VYCHEIILEEGVECFKLGGYLAFADNVVGHGRCVAVEPRSWMASGCWSGVSSTRQNRLSFSQAGLFNIVFLCVVCPSVEVD
jgi:hypothetical protein